MVRFLAQSRKPDPHAQRGSGLRDYLGVLGLRNRGLQPPQPPPPPPPPLDPPLNIHDKNPVDIEEGETFSIVCSSFALEVACKTYDKYKAGIKKLVKLLRLGEYIAILLAELETFFCVGELSSACAHLTENSISWTV